MHNRKIAVVGLGYVGLPVAVEFGLQAPTIGFDINEKRIELLRQRIDLTNEADKESLQKTDVLFTSDVEELKKADFYIVAVPTPVDDAHIPDLMPVVMATKTVASVLKKGDIVVFESTVYPGVTEEECVPVLEKISGLKYNEDFFVGYSPERINPGDKEHTFKTIKKVVSGSTPETLDIVAAVYESVVQAGVYRAPTLKVAEASKAIENAQRDVNIAFMNELAMIFSKMGIDTHDVIEAASTKWNFLPFKPGMVGGHCIGVDPYYLTHKAELYGYNSQIILSGRKVNDHMGKYIAGCIIKAALKNDMVKGRLKVAILGMTFKENVPDIRNSKVKDIYDELQAYHCDIKVCDPYAEPDKLKAEYGVELADINTITDADVVILAVAHDQYRQGGWELIKNLIGSKKAIVADIKALLPRNQKPENVVLWRL